MTTTDQTFTIPACPPWCKQPAGHPYVDSTTEGYPARSHWGDGAKAWPARFETIQGDRIVTVGPWVTITTDDGDQLTPAEPGHSPPSSSAQQTPSTRASLRPTHDPRSPLAVSPVGSGVRAVPGQAMCQNARMRSCSTATAS